MSEQTSADSDLPEIEADRIRNPEADDPEPRRRLIDTGTMFAEVHEGKQR